MDRECGQAIINYYDPQRVDYVVNSVTLLGPLSCQRCCPRRSLRALLRPLRMRFRNEGAASDILCVFVTKLRLRWFMDKSSNSTVHVVCSCPQECCGERRLVFDLVEHESDKDGLAHSQHGSLQRFSWECENVFSLSKTLVQLTLISDGPVQLSICEVLIKNTHR